GANRSRISHHRFPRSSRGVNLSFHESLLVRQRFRQLAAVAGPQGIDRMSDPNRIAPPLQITTDLQQTTDVAGEHSVHHPTSSFPSSSLGTSAGKSLKDIFDLALTQALGHFRLGEVVTPGRAAADFRLR